MLRAVVRCCAAPWCLAAAQTTAHTICWTLFLVATHPEVESSVMKELNSLGLLATQDCPTPQRMEWEHLAQVGVILVHLVCRMYCRATQGDRVPREQHCKQPTALAMSKKCWLSLAS